MSSLDLNDQLRRVGGGEDVNRIVLLRQGGGPTWSCTLPPGIVQPDGRNTSCHPPDEGRSHGSMCELIPNGWPDLRPGSGVRYRRWPAIDPRGRCGKGRADCQKPGASRKETPDAGKKIDRDGGMSLARPTEHQKARDATTRSGAISCHPGRKFSVAPHRYDPVEPCALALVNTPSRSRYVNKVPVSLDLIAAACSPICPFRQGKRPRWSPESISPRTGPTSTGRITPAPDSLAVNAGP